MLRCSGRIAALLLPCRVYSAGARTCAAALLLPCRVYSAGARTCAARPDVGDVERLSRGEPAKRRGTGSREVPHRLNAAERASWETAKKKGYVVLTSGGYRRERKGSPLANSWRQYADANAWPCILLHNGGGEPPRPEVVVVDLSPLRVADAAGYHTTHAACLARGKDLGATLTRDDVVADSPPGEPNDSGAIWQLRPVNLEFTCADRASAKVLAEALSEALCGVQPAAATSLAAGERRARRLARKSDDASEDYTA